jgi:hypothetical protein
MPGGKKKSSSWASIGKKTLYAAGIAAALHIGSKVAASALSGGNSADYVYQSPYPDDPPF